MSRLQRIRIKQQILSKEKEILEKELQLLEQERIIVDLQTIFDEHCAEIEKLEKTDITQPGFNIDDNEFIRRYDELQEINGVLHGDICLSKQILMKYNDDLIQSRLKLEELQSLIQELMKENTEIDTVKKLENTTFIDYKGSSPHIGSTRFGHLILKNGTVIEAQFKNGIIVINRKLTLKKTEPIDVHEIEQYISYTSMLDSSFYQLLHPFPTNSELIAKGIPYRDISYSQFLDGLKKTTNPVRLIALCHGLICDIMKPDGIKVIRVNNTEQGVCSFSTQHIKHTYLNELIIPDPNQTTFINKARVLATTNMHVYFSVKLTTLTDETRGSNYKISEEHCTLYNQAYDACHHIKDAPFKEFQPVQEQFDKIFESNPGLCFLFIGYIPTDSTEYEYINLFTLHPKFVLSDIIKTYMSPFCKELYLADFSCAVPCNGFTPTLSQLQTLGGRRKTKKIRKFKGIHQI